MDEWEAWRSKSRRRVPSAGLEMNTSKVCGAERGEGVNLRARVFKKVRRGIHLCKKNNGRVISRYVFAKNRQFILMCVFQ